jgi:hypothetical protein
MDDHRDTVRRDNEADLDQQADPIWPSDQREPVIQLENVDRIAERMAHVLIPDPVFPSTLGNNGLHASQVTLPSTG